MTPWFIATEQFTPERGERWDGYIRWSGLTQLHEVVSLDGMLCPPLLGGNGGVKDDYWPHIVKEDFMLDFFVAYEFLKQEVAGIQRKLNVLCVFRNPEALRFGGSCDRNTERLHANCRLWAVFRSVAENLE
jgi:hypothetical protein